MKKILALLVSLSLLCCGCAQTPVQKDDTVHILATTYPVYLFTTAVADGLTGEGGSTEVSLLVNEQTSCLHDYTLTVNDMKAIERADIIIINGVGMEDFMDDALAHSNALVIDCSEGIDLLPATGHHNHDHSEENESDHYDPHIWMSADNAAIMCANIARGLSEYNESWAAPCQESLNAACTDLEKLAAEQAKLTALPRKDLITFHDGFQYYAAGNGLTLLKSIEEEEGSEASAAAIKEIVSLIKSHDIPAVFTEKNGSESTAQAIARETGVTVHSLDMIMSGEGTGLQPYLDAMTANYNTVIEALGG